MTTDTESHDDWFIDWFRSIPPADKQKRLDEYQRREPPKLTQDWHAYDSAKRNEEGLFKEMLCELLLAAELNEPKTPGRKGYSLRDRIFCAMVKVWTRTSLRKTESLLKDLKRLGYISKVPCYKSIDNFLGDERLIEILDRLIALSAMPLINLEDTAAVDASGFSLTKYAQWSNYKWGKKKEGVQHKWRKAHIVVGCKTNVILGIRMSKKNVHDTLVFPTLAKAAVTYFDIKEITADKAYSSAKNLQFAYDLGMIPFIPFKKTSGIRKDGKVMVWNRIFRHFMEHGQDFNDRYHKRSNVETTFFQLKQRFGSHITTKKWLSNGVEIKLKALCHNLAVLIQELFESGAQPDFYEATLREKYPRIERNR